MEILVSRINVEMKAEDIDLLSQLVMAGMRCQGVLIFHSVQAVIEPCNVAFTSQQMSKLSALLDSASLPAPTPAPGLATTKPGNGAFLCNRDSDVSLAHESVPETQNGKVTPQQSESRLGQHSLGALAKEFGVEAQLVEALAQRLSAIR